jgi:hypothetical protein
MTRSTSRSSLLITPSLFIMGSFLFVLAIPAWGQKDTGSIVGTVKDPSGAMAANAQVNFLLAKSGPQESNSSTVSGASEFGFSDRGAPTATDTILAEAVFLAQARQSKNWSLLFGHAVESGRRLHLGK